MKFPSFGLIFIYKDRFIIHLHHPLCVFRIVAKNKLELVRIVCDDVNEDDLSPIDKIRERAEHWYYHTYIKQNDAII